MQLFIFYSLIFIPLVLATNSTETTTTEKSIDDQLIRNATNPVKDAVLRSPVAYNQGSLIPAFPAVSKIRGKAKKPDSKAEIEEDVRQLINSLNHKKSGGVFTAKRGATGSNRAQFLVEIDSGSYTGDAYASGYRGLPESQVAPSNSYLGAITKSQRNGANRNTFGSYGSVDSAKGQTSLYRAGIGSNQGSDPYQSSYTAQQSVLGYGGYGQGFGSSQNEQAPQEGYGDAGQTYGTQGYTGAEEQQSVYPVYGGTNQQTESYGTQAETGAYSGYAATGTQTEYTGYGSQPASTQTEYTGYGSQTAGAGYQSGYESEPEYSQTSGQEQGQTNTGYGANPVYEIPATTSQSTGAEDYGQSYGQQAQTGYSGYGSSASTPNPGIEAIGYEGSAYGTNYGASDNAKQASSGYDNTAYGNYGTTEYTQPTGGYGSSVYGTADSTATNTGYSNTGYGASYGTAETAQPQTNTGYSSYAGGDYSNYGQNGGVNNYQQAGATGYGSGGNAYEQENTYGQSTVGSTIDYTTQQANGYGSNYQQNSYGSNQQQGGQLTADYNKQGYIYPTQTQAPATGYYSSPDSNSYVNNYQAPATYPQTGYQTTNYASTPTGYGGAGSPYAEASVYLPDSSRYSGQVDMSMGYGSLKSHAPPTKAKLANIASRKQENELDGYKKRV